MWDNASAMARMIGWLKLLTVLILLSAGGVWLYNSPYFPIKQVKIEGDLQRVGSKQLQTIAQKYIRGNIFKADLNGAQEAFQSLPWIQSALVRRRLPDTVEIILEEHVPVARWNKSGLVDEQGKIFQAPTDEHFPRFEGNSESAGDMVRHYHLFQTTLKPLGLKIVELQHTPRSAWSLVLESGLVIRLGRTDEVERLERFVQVWPSVLRQNKERLEYVDMRYKDGFSVRYRPQQAGEGMPSENHSDE